MKLVASKLQAELADAMRMCGAASIADIDAGMIWREG